MRLKIYIFRGLRNSIVLNLLFPLYEIIIKLFAWESFEFAWFSATFPNQLIVPTILGFLTPFLIPYKKLTIDMKEHGILQDDIIKLPEKVDYELKKKKFGLYIFRYRSGLLKFFYLYFDRIYMKFEENTAQIYALTTIINSMMEELNTLGHKDNS